MSGLVGNPFLLASAAGGATGYSISRSLRFNSSDSAYLSRTPASAGNRKTWTWAGWVKRSGLGTDQALFSAPQGGGYPNTGIAFNGSNQLRFFAADASSTTFVERVTSAVYRDTSAWMHIVVAVDYANTQAKLYVNGSEITAFATNTGPSNLDGVLNSSGVVHVIGQFSNTWYFNGYLADIHFIDGQALDPTSFGEFSATTGVWMPKAYSGGSYGTNGFHLDFSNNASAAALGTDTSGNGNTWTVNNLSVTAGAGNDSLVDVPTNGSEVDTGIGGQVRGNYATWNPLDQGGSITLANGNLEATTPTSGQPTIRGTVAVSTGKWYWEVTPTTQNYACIGVVRVTDSLASFLGSTAGGYGFYSEQSGAYSTRFNNGSEVSYGTGFVANDVIGVALDLNAGTLTFYKNGTSQGQAYSGLSGTFAPAIADLSNSASITGIANFGQRPFAYTAPSGFKALNTSSLPAPVITKPSTVMDVLTITGANQAYTGLNFSPDFLWFKRRDNIEYHYLFDTIRGGAGLLYSNRTDAEVTGTTYISAFGSNGFTTANGLLVNSASYVTWAWDAGSSTVTNTQGSISSQVRANASAGFSIVSYTGNGAAANIGHGLGVEPHLIIHKFRSASSNWSVYTKATGAGGRLLLNSTAAFSSDGAFPTAPTSSVFYVNSGLNDNGVTIVAYCFAPVAGYSSMGSFVANANSDGPFVYTSFKPRLVLCKLSSASGADWLIFDAARSPYNVVQANLRPNTSGAEESAFARIDILSNGFKVRAGSGVEPNGTNGNTYIYAAWAESPFNYSRAA